MTLFPSIIVDSRSMFSLKGRGVGTAPPNSSKLEQNRVHLSKQAEDHAF